MKDYAATFYSSKAWQDCREAYKKKVNYLCEDCLNKGIVKGCEEVHHIVFITPFNVNDPNITLNFKNLVALCRECHRARHNREDKKTKRYEVDESGRVIPHIF